jgi:hypothetical protein
MINWKGFGTKRPWRYLPGGIEENHENISQDSRSLGRDLNPRPQEYSAGVLTTGQRHSVMSGNNVQNKITRDNKDLEKIALFIYLFTQLSSLHKIPCTPNTGLNCIIGTSVIYIIGWATKDRAGRCNKNRKNYKSIIHFGR